MVDNNKKGFSLIAVMTLLVVVSLIMVLSMPLISKRHQRIANDAEDGAKGYYICNRIYDERTNEDKICEQYFANGHEVSERKCRHEGEEGYGCHPEIPSNVQHLSIRIVGGGGGGAGIPKMGESGRPLTGAEITYKTGLLPKSIANMNDAIKNVARLLPQADEDDEGTILQTIRDGVFNTDGTYKFGELPKFYLETKCLRTFSSGPSITCDGNEYQAILRVEADFAGNYDYIQVVDTDATDSTKVSRNGFIKHRPIYTTSSTPSNNSIIAYKRNGSLSFPWLDCNNKGEYSYYSPKINRTECANKDRWSPVPYFEFVLTGFWKRLYSGIGGHPGEVITHITTDLNADMNITLGRGGEGGNCYVIRNGAEVFLDPSDCHGENGEETRIDFNGANALYPIVARGGRGAGIDDTSEEARNTFDDNFRYDQGGITFREYNYLLPYNRLLALDTNNKIDERKKSSLKETRGQASQVHYFGGAGDGGSGAGMRDKCRAGTLHTKLRRYGHTQYTAPSEEYLTQEPYTSWTYDFEDRYGHKYDNIYGSLDDTTDNGNRYCFSGTVRDHFEYIWYDGNGDVQTRNAAGNGVANHIGQRGSGGAVIITW